MESNGVNDPGKAVSLIIVLHFHYLYKESQMYSICCAAYPLPLQGKVFIIR
jgi:hypothetical protein